MMPYPEALKYLNQWILEQPIFSQSMCLNDVGDRPIFSPSLPLEVGSFSVLQGFGSDDGNISRKPQAI